MQLSPLQSRLVATVAASCLLVLLYLTLSSPHFALAAELDNGVAAPATHLPILDDVTILQDRDDQEKVAVEEGGENDAAEAFRRRAVAYEPYFGLFDRGIVGRAPAGVTGLANNVPQQLNLDPSTTQVYVFEKIQMFGRREAPASRIELRDELGNERETGQDGELDDQRASLLPRQSTKTVFISANTCMQPQLKPDKTAMDPPQLTMYVSNTSKNQSPGPKADPSQQTFQVFQEGAVMLNMTASDDIFIGISAPNISTDFTGIWNFELAVSIDSWYHSYNNDIASDLIWVDSGASAALLITHNLTQSTDPAVSDELMSKQPYVMFAQNDKDTSINGVRFSYCGLQNYAQIAATKNGKFTNMVLTGMTKRGQGNLPKQEFYFMGLNSSSNYQGILAKSGTNGTAGSGIIGGGGHIVSRATQFNTKSVGGNCEIIFNLTFCNQTAYAVPSNPSKFTNVTNLAQFYDNLASSAYDNFKKVLAQIPCEAPSTERYSLARNCTDCDVAYKNWLCSVTIPRCEDFSVNHPWLQPRAMGQPFPDGTQLDAAAVQPYANFKDQAAYNNSRNPAIDAGVAPGPYKEVLPCDDLCYNLVQSCPAKMGFSCPMPGSPGFNTSYGRRDNELDRDGDVTCNYPGAAHFISDARRTSMPWSLFFGMSGVVALALL